MSETRMTVFSGQARASVTVMTNLKPENCRLLIVEYSLWANKTFHRFQDGKTQYANGIKYIEIRTAK